MRRYWMITPYDSHDLVRRKIFDKVWKYDLENKTIAIGWRTVDDPSKLTEDELKIKVIESYKGKGRNIKYIFNALWSFYHDIRKDDIIIARKGLKRIIGIGKVVGPAFFNIAKAKERVFFLDDDWYPPNFINVDWKRVDIDLGVCSFRRNTIYEVYAEQFPKIFGRQIGEDIVNF